MSSSESEEPSETTRMTLGDHLQELRRRLFRSILALVIALSFAWFFREDLSDKVTWPWRQAVADINADLVERSEEILRGDPARARTDYFLTADPADQRLRNPVDERLSAFGVGEGFFFALNVSLYFAALLAGPYVLWEMWQFIAAGLYPKEKRLVYLYFPASVLLFLAGVAFCYFVIVPSGLFFLATTMPVEMIRPQLGAEKYFDFLSMMCLAMGATFQLPILMIFFSSIGLVDPTSYGKWRKHFIVAALLVAAVITPSPDAYTQLLTAGPMLVLYEIGIWISRWRAKPRETPGAGAA